MLQKAVIWAIQRLDDVNYKKAEHKYKKGFQQTKEELTKQKCNEILNKINKESVTHEVIKKIAPANVEMQSESSLGNISDSVSTTAQDESMNQSIPNPDLYETIESILDKIENKEFSNEELNNYQVIKDISVAMELEKSMSNDDSLSL